MSRITRSKIKKNRLRFKFRKVQQLKKSRLEIQQNNLQTISDSGAVLVPIPGKKNSWESFKLLKLGDTIDTEKVYCSVCFETGRMLCYSSKTSFTILKKHLENVHNGVTKQPKTNHMDQILCNMGESNQNTREKLVISLTLRYIMTQIPIHIIENSYEKQFLLNHGLIESVQSCPSERSLSDTGLEKLNKYT